MHTIHSAGRAYSRYLAGSYGSQREDSSSWEWMRDSSHLQAPLASLSSSLLLVRKTFLSNFVKLFQGLLPWDIPCKTGQTAALLWSTSIGALSHAAVLIQKHAMKTNYLESCLLVPAVDSWPGVCQTLLSLAISELGKKRPEASIQRVVKKFFQQSEDGRKTSRPGLLLNRASRIFVAFQRIMSTATLMTPLGQEFGNILRVHLLPVRQYTATATPTSFQGTSFIPLGDQCWLEGLSFVLSHYAVGKLADPSFSHSSWLWMGPGILSILVYVIISEKKSSSFMDLIHQKMTGSCHDSKEQSMHLPVKWIQTNSHNLRALWCESRPSKNNNYFYYGYLLWWRYAQHLHRPAGEGGPG